MDDADRVILNEIQWTFPLASRPFHEIASKHGMDPRDVMERLIRLKQQGVLRQLSAIFDTRRLGYKSSLVAMDVEPDRLEHVAEMVNRHPGVSHNYERDNRFNLWFTLAVPPGSDLKSELGRFSGLDGVRAVRMLPTIRLFKIGVKLEMIEDQKLEIKPSEKKKDVAAEPFVPTEFDKEFVRQLQQDLEIVDEPFEKYARVLGISAQDVFSKLEHYQSIGVLRRFAAILRHRDAGFVANGMIVWKVPDESITEIGETLGSFPQVSHCYQRPTYPDWPYSIFSMIHCKTIPEAKAVAAAISDQIGITDYDILFSLREFKKTRVEYFVEQNFEMEPSIRSRRAQ